MTLRSRLATFLFCLCIPALLVSQNNQNNPAALASMEAKLQHVQANGALEHPDQTPTVFTEEEVNAYAASGKVDLPQGVQSVRFQAHPEVVVTTMRVDFDQVKAGRSSYNPLLSVFTGVHDVVANAHAHGAGGQGYVHIDSVSMDGVEIPRFALELFVEKYIKPKYPNVGLDSQFPLPARVDTATLGEHQVAITQK